MTPNIDVGDVLSRTFNAYRDQFTLLFPAAVAIFLPVAIVNGIVRNGGGVLAALIAGLLGLAATYLYQGMVVRAAEDILDGRRDETVGSLISGALPVLGRLVGAGLLASIAIFIGFLLLIAPGLYLLTIWALIAPVIVLERAGMFDAFGRSHQLVRGNGWQVLGVLVLLFLIQFVASIVLGAIIGGISSTVVGYAAADIVARSLIAPLSGLAAAILYFDLKRLRGEGASAPAAPPTQPPPPPAGPEAPVV